MTTRPARRRALIVLAVLGAVLALALPGAYGASYTRINGNGSSWAGNAVLQWQTDVKAQGVTVDYTADGSSSGRKNFAIGLSDFAVSEIPYKGDTADPQDSSFPNFDYSMLPVVAGGTSFMYNLQVNGQQMQTLRLSQLALAKIFSGEITQWNDPAIAATNPGVNLPAQRITVVVRSDGSGATAQFTLWMLRQFPAQWRALCAKTKCNPNSATSYFPYDGLENFTAQSGSQGVTTYTANTPYTINYDEYSYALGVGFPVAQVQNAAGFYTVPTETAVAVALTQAKINNDPSSENYLSQDLSRVYAYGDPRTYPISAYSYMIVPAQTRGNFDTAKGATLGYYATYSLCEGQRTMGALGYSPLPMNLVLAAMDQVLKVPGVDSATKSVISSTRNGVKSGSGNPCNNPTFRPGDSPSHNILIDTAPFPEGCDAACQAPWTGAAAAENDGPGSKGPKGNQGDDQDGGAGPGPGGEGPAAPGATAGATTGAAPTPGGAAPVAGAPGASVNCDPDTGVCTGGTTTGTTADGTVPLASPQVMEGQSTWGAAQAALALSAVLGLLLVLGPPLASRWMDRPARKVGQG
jgi:phosphate ABC transporter phosphate-binding protein